MKPSGMAEKAYCVPLKGLVIREFLVYAESAEEAREQMLGDRSNCLAMDDYYEEKGLGRITRMPTEDKYRRPAS